MARGSNPHPLHEGLWPTLAEREEALRWFGCSRLDIAVHVLSGTAHVTVLESPPTPPLSERVDGPKRELRDRHPRCSKQEQQGTQRLRDALYAELESLAQRARESLYGGAEGAAREARLCALIGMLDAELP